MSWLKLASGLAPAALLLLVAVPSCSSDPAVPTPEVDEPTFVQEVAALVCKRRTGCQCDSVTPPAPPVGGPECEAQVRQELSTTLLRPAGNEGLTFDGSCAALVLDEVNKQPGCNFSLRSLLQSTRCELGCSVLSGKARAGEPCPLSNTGSFPFFSQCSGDLACNNGVCADSCPGDPGEECGSSTVQYRGCRQGSFCYCPQEVGGQGGCVCSSGAAAGESCVNLSCAEGLLCGCPSGGFDCQYTQRVCVALPKAGAPCLNQQCAEGAFCDAQPPSPPPDSFVPTCKPLLPNGAACNSVEQCQSKFCPDGSCRATPHLGEPCPGGLCGDGLACTGGVCVATPGQLCSSL